MEQFNIWSPAYKEGGWIPSRYSGYGEDISPQIKLENLSSKAVSLVITLDDLDHPIWPGFNHWVAWNLPPVSDIPQGLPKGETITSPISAKQGRAYGKHCYRGPKPPFRWNHRYVITVYVLNTSLTLPTSATKKDVLSAMDGHILQCANLTANYQRGKG